MDRAERRNDEHPKGDPTEKEKKKWVIGIGKDGIGKKNK